MKQIVCFALLICSLLPFCSSCSSKNIPEYEKYDRIFLSKLDRDGKLDSIHISELICCYYGDCYYYTVQYTKDSNDNQYELLYIFRNDDLEIFYSVKKPEECMQFFPDSYQRFLTAKKNGVMKEYTEEEIQSMIDKY